MDTIYSQRKKHVYPGSRRGRHFQLCRIAGLPRNGERCEAGGGWEDVKVALPVVRGLHGSRTEGTTRRFKVGDFKTEFNGLGVLRTDIRTVPGRRRGDRRWAVGRHGIPHWMGGDVFGEGLFAK